MTTELEQKFYVTFGIEEQCICPYFFEYMENGCEICIKYFQGKKDCNEKNRYKYPEITDRILLELEKIILNTGLMLLLKSPNKDKFEYIVYEKYKEIGFCERETRTDALLQLCINIQNGYTSNGQGISYKKDIKQDVKSLFESEVLNAR